MTPHFWFKSHIIVPSYIKFICNLYTICQQLLIWVFHDFKIGKLTTSLNLRCTILFISSILTIRYHIFLYVLTKSSLHSTPQGKQEPTYENSALHNGKERGFSHSLNNLGHKVQLSIFKGASLWYPNSPFHIESNTHQSWLSRLLKWYIE